MSTRSLIIRKNEVGKYESIYCHWDGYPTCNGVILYNHYNNPERVKELISHGDLSSLHVYINPETRKDYMEHEHTFNNPQPNTCVFYDRDRHEVDVEAKVFNTLGKALNQDCCQEYAYVYENNEWRVHDYEGKNPSKFNEMPLLKDVLEEQKDNIRIRQ